MCSVFKHKVFIFSRNASYLLYNTHSLRKELFITNVTSGSFCNKCVFSDAVGSGLLTLQGVGVVGSDETESSVFLNPIENGGLLASNFFFKKQEVLDEKLFKLKFLRLRGMTDLYFQKDSGATSFKTKLAKIFSPLVKQVNFFKKVSINAVSWVTYFIDYFKGTEVESKLRDELDTSAELFKKFFINTTFYKKVQ
jgi:hypothetical protein